MLAQNSLKRGTWSDQELATLCARYPHDKAEAIADDLNRPLSAVYARAHLLGISKSDEFLSSRASGRLDGSESPWDRWTDEDLATLYRRYPHEKTGFIARDLNRTVNSCYARAKLDGLRKTAAFMSTPDAGRTNGQLGISSRFKPGHAPANKGIKGWQAGGRSAETQFKKGHKPINELPVGSHRRTTKERYWCRKIQMTGTQRERWILLHKLIYVEHRGEIPPRYIVRFIDAKKRTTLPAPSDRPHLVKTT